MAQDQQSLFVNEDRLFEDDWAVHQTFLHSRYASFHRLDAAVSHIGILVGVAAGLPSWIWMMPPVMAQIVATQIFRTFEHFLLGFFGLHLFLLESLFQVFMVLGIVLVLSFLVLLFLDLISKSSKRWFTCWWNWVQSCMLSMSGSKLGFM